MQNKKPHILFSSSGTKALFRQNVMFRLVPGNQSEHNILLVPENKFGHRFRARALAPAVVIVPGAWALV